MSIHPSLRSHSKGGSQGRNVMKRHERVRHLMSQGLWAQEKSVLGLPKIKQTKIKSRKTSGKEKEETATKSPATESTGAA